VSGKVRCLWEPNSIFSLSEIPPIINLKKLCFAVIRQFYYNINLEMKMCGLWLYYVVLANTPFKYSNLLKTNKKNPRKNQFAYLWKGIASDLDFLYLPSHK